MSHSFDQKAKTYDTDKQLALSNKLVKSILEVTNSKSLGKMLDFGGGTGNKALALSDLTEQVVIADISQPMLSEAEEKIKQSHSKKISTYLIQDNIRAINETFDTILVSLVLHHIEDYKTSLSDLRSLLNPGGQMIIIDFDDSASDSHQKGFSPEGFKQELQELGAKAVAFTQVAKRQELFMRPEGKAILWHGKW